MNIKFCMMSLCFFVSCSITTNLKFVNQPTLNIIVYFSHKKKGKGKNPKKDMSVYLVYVFITIIHLHPKCLLKTYLP